MTKSKYHGFTLVELMVAIVLGLFVMLVMMQIFTSTKRSGRIQDGLTRVQEDGRLAIHLVSNEIRKTGFRAPVWNEPLNGYFPLTSASVDGANGANDTLQMMYEDNIDCLGALNTSSIDPETGEPEMLYKRVTFAVDDTQNLLWTCEYGNSPGELTAQYSNQNIIGGVESFQVLYGVDTDFPPDFSVNSWTNATNIDPESTVCLQSQYLCEAANLLNSMQLGVPVALKVGVLLASPDSAITSNEQTGFTVLDVAVPAAQDQKLRKLFTSTVTIRNLTL